MQTVDATVRLQTLDGAWETCGVDRLRGVFPEGLQLTANSWGPDSASFNLNRDPGAVWPDLGAFTPVEIEVGGVAVWDGFIGQTPTTDADGGSVNVQCKGWQYHLDDDSFEKLWIHSSFAGWKDAREYQTTTVNYYRPQGRVSISDGTISLGWEKGSTIKANTYAAVIFDAGPDNKISAASLSWIVADGSGMLGSTDGKIKLYLKGADTVAQLAGSGYDALWTSTTSGIVMGTAGTTYSASGTLKLTSAGATRPCRYVMLGVRWLTTDADATYGTVATGNYSIKVNNLALTTDVAYHNATNKTISGLTASDVVKNALDSAPLLTGQRLVTATSFAIPHFSSVEGGRTPREYIEAANSYHDNIAKLNPGKQFVYKPKPTAPTVAIGEWGGADFEDASSNSGEEIYNKVIVEGTGPDGLPIRQPRYAAGLSFLKAAPTFVPDSVINGKFTSGTTNWAAATGSTLSTTTTAGTAITGTSLVWTYTTGGSSAAWSLTLSLASGFTFKKNTLYTLSYATRTVLANSPAIQLIPVSNFGEYSGSAFLANSATANDSSSFGASGAIAYPSISWTPTADVVSSGTNVKLKLTFDQDIVDVLVSSGSYIVIDDVVIAYSKPTIPDRRGFTRTKRLQVEAMTTTTAATQLGDTFLTSHAVTPLKGSVKIQPGGARDYLSGSEIHPSQLLLDVGERIHLSHRIDPDTGAHGRDGDIASVAYDHADQSAQLSIDNQRNRFENLLSRLSVVTGSALKK